ncbi:hypothetical protein LRX75_07745 [Rhizobium sp. DKSPLA3]|uniref:Secreted protein n=1 Tax=Rhizobium quercicola TaxID=2901226 RepID=A0A9X1NPU1_9HYPH|nr:hypothetical protein [Rhizobium quercicola]MCD7108932.1 hypothetical protein [Rhizobium quercicola]
MPKIEALLAVLLFLPCAELYAQDAPPDMGAIILERRYSAPVFQPPPNLGFGGNTFDQITVPRPGGPMKALDTTLPAVPLPLRPACNAVPDWCSAVSDPLKYASCICGQ